MKILIADTDPQRTAALAGLLSNTPAYSVWSLDANHPESLIALGHAGLFDVVLTSSSVKTQDNAIIFDWARSQNPHATLLMFGPESEDQKARSIQLGASEFIDLPKLQKVLKQKIETIRLAVADAANATPSSSSNFRPETLEDSDPNLYGNDQTPIKTKDPRDPGLTSGLRLGHYTILEHLATGGMGAVYKAFEPSLQREVAIKVLRPDFALNTEYSQMFEDEARAIAAVRHPHIVPIYFIGREKSVLFFSMALINGLDCQQILNAQKSIEVPRVYEIAKQSVSALAEAWRHHIVHRDIKPSNLMIESDTQRVLLTDFGLARCLDQAREGNLTGEGWGSPGYVSPEQIRQEHCDLRSDIYSLGATLFHLLTGRTAFDSEKNEEEVRKHLDAPFPYDYAVSRRMPAGWIALLQKMMAKNPAERFQDYETLTYALDHMSEMVDYQPTESITVMPVLQREDWNPELLNGLVLPYTREMNNFTGQFSAMVTTERLLAPQTVFPSLDPFRDQILEICNHNTGKMKELTAFAKAMPEYAAYVVALAECPFYSDGTEVDSIEEALQRVGMLRSQTLALLTLLIRDIRGSSKYFDWLPLWQHSISTGLLTELIMKCFRIRSTGSELVSGIFHDIGKIVLGDIVPMAQLSVMRESFDKQKDIRECEIASIKLDHSTAGAVWARKTYLPGIVVEAIADHHLPKGGRRYRGHTAALNLANHFCKRFGLGYSGNAIMDTPRMQEQEGLQLLFELSPRSELDFDLFVDEIVSLVPSLPVFKLE